MPSIMVYTKRNFTPTMEPRWNHDRTLMNCQAPKVQDGPYYY